jgi:hypothetical protein
MRIFLFTGFLFSSFFVLCSPIFAKPIKNCFPVARIVMNKNNHLLPGSVICDGDPIRSMIKQGQQFICFLDNLGLTVWTEKSQCALTLNQRDRFGGSNNLIRPVPKGAETDDFPQIIRPLGTALLRSPKSFAWYAVPGASTYSVEVLGADVKWERKVAGTSMDYPKDLPLMRLGNSYKVTIFAYQGTTPIKSYSRPYTLISAEKKETVIRKIAIASAYSLPDDDRAYVDLNSIYLSQGLKEEAASALEARVASGTSDPNIFAALSTQLLNEGHSSLAARIMDQLNKLKASQ